MVFCQLLSQAIYKPGMILFEAVLGAEDKDIHSVISMIRVVVSVSYLKIIDGVFYSFLARAFVI